MHSPEDMQRLVMIASRFEAISDEDECTTRYVVLPGKPLQDFLIAGINSGKYFADLVRDVEREGEHVENFRHFVSAAKIGILADYSAAAIFLHVYETDVPCNAEATRSSRAARVKSRVLAVPLAALLRRRLAVVLHELVPPELRLRAEGLLGAAGLRAAKRGLSALGDAAFLAAVAGTVGACLCCMVLQSRG